jgi:hypothetical protein
MQRVALSIVLAAIEPACGDGGGAYPDAAAAPDAAAPDAAAPDAGPLARGARLIGMDVSPAADDDYDAAIAIAKGLGVDVVSVFLQWDVLEPAPGVYDDTLLSIIDVYYPAADVAVALTLAPINTTQRALPPDLMALAWDDPQMIARFEALIDFVLAELPNVELHALNIGSEMDVMFETDPTQWSAFETLYEAAVARVKARRPTLRMTVEPTYNGMMGPARAAIQSLNASSDAIGVSYYPRTTDVAAAFDALAADYPSRPIVFHQYGFPSSEDAWGSLAAQVEFIEKTFAAWDRHAAQVELIEFTWLHDMNPANVQCVVEYYCWSCPGAPACGSDPACLPEVCVGGEFGAELAGARCPRTDN